MSKKRKAMWWLLAWALGINLALGIIAAQVGKVFFLDMAGTALAAIAYGPFWGVVVAGCTGTLLSLLPGMDLYFYYLPVNVVGAVAWGVMSHGQLHPFGAKRRLRRDQVSDYLASFKCILRLWGLGAVVGLACTLVIILVRFDWHAMITHEMVTASLARHPMEQITKKFAEGLTAQSSVLFVAVAPADLISTVPDKILCTVIAFFVLGRWFPGGLSFVHSRAIESRLMRSLWIWPAVGTCALAFGLLVWNATLVANAAVNFRPVVGWLVVFLACAVVLAWWSRGHRPALEPAPREATNVFGPIELREFKELSWVLTDSAWLLGLLYATFVIKIRQPSINTPVKELLQEGFGVASFLAAVGFVLPFVSRRIHKDGVG